MRLATLALVPVLAAPATTPPLTEIRVNVVLAGVGLAYVGQTSGFAILDLTDPAAPRETSRLRLEATIRDVAVRDGRAYLAAGAYGMIVADVADPAAPKFTLRYDTPGTVVRLALGGEHLVYLAEARHGLSVVDLKIPDRPRRAASFSTADEVLSVVAQGGLLATAEGKAGVRLFDLERPENPTERAVLREAAGAIDVAFMDKLLLVALGEKGLLAYDLADLRSPRLVATDATHPARAFAASERAVVVAMGDAGLRILAFEDGQLRQLGTARLPGSIPAGRVSLTAEAKALVAADRFGIAVVDLADPAQPVMLHPRERRMKVTFP